MLENLLLKYLQPWSFSVGRSDRYVLTFTANIFFIRGILDKNGYKDVQVSGADCFNRLAR